ncbi:hypothetical protein ABEB36_014028 [Hypothenemus hampei]|uniref:HTH psq-type domain-containing protein n=1 Tax=Hypothenemus hampei TaxID=57062 RepID=A0ABD1E326_HYPHA
MSRGALPTLYIWGKLITFPNFYPLLCLLRSIMVRNYKRKTIPISEKKIKAAVHAVRINKMPVKTAADKFGVPRGTLVSWLKRTTMEQTEKNALPTLVRGKKKVFTSEAESILMEYVQTCNDMYYGVSAKQLRILA